MTTMSLRASSVVRLDKYLNYISGTNTMTLSEIVDLSVQQRNVQRLKQNAKRQAEQVKAAQARLKILKAQQQLRAIRKV